MRSVVLRCAALDRDIEGLRRTVPGLLVYEGQLAPNGEQGCLDGHKAIVRAASNAGAPSVFVLEDDCQFTQHFQWKRWLEDVSWAEAHGYDLLVGGSTRTYGERVVRAGLLEVSAFHSAHCIAYFASGYEKALHAVVPYDWSLGRDCGMRCALVHPFVAVQRPAYSGTLRNWVDYTALYLQHEMALGERFKVQA